MRLVLLLFALVLPVCGAQHDFLHNRGKLAHANTLAVDSTERYTLLDVELRSDRRDTVRGRIRLPVFRGERHPLAFLVVGIETGKSVVELIKGYDSVIVFGMDYPFMGEMDFSGLKGFGTSLALREAAFQTVPNIALCLDWLSSLPQIDTNDITLVAVSFGVFTGVPAAVADQRVDRLVVIQAGGELSTIIAANSERLGSPLPSWLAGWLGSAILGPFEPNDYIARFSPRPLLLVSGESDRFFPASSVQSLYDRAREPKEWIRHQSGHVMPSERALIEELTDIVARRLYGRED